MAKTSSGIVPRTALLASRAYIATLTVPLKKLRKSTALLRYALINVYPNQGRA